MNEDIDEVVTIAVMSNGDESIRTITNEYECTDTCWPHLVQVFLEQLQGLGYCFAANPDEMANVLADFHQECACAECNGCDEEEKAPDVEEKKYPYTGMLKNADGITIVEFTRNSAGKVIFTSGHVGNLTGQFSENWDESLFEKVSK